MPCLFCDQTPETANVAEIFKQLKKQFSLPEDANPKSVCNFFVHMRMQLDQAEYRAKVNSEAIHNIKDQLRQQQRHVEHLQSVIAERHARTLEPTKITVDIGSLETQWAGRLQRDSPWFANGHAWDKKVKKKL